MINEHSINTNLTYMTKEPRNYVAETTVTMNSSNRRRIAYVIKCICIIPLTWVPVNHIIYV